MLSITIKEEVNTISDLADMLRYIAKQIDEGYTTGYGPTWSIEGEEENEEENS